jgi:signal transduction histidine kinase
MLGTIIFIGGKRADCKLLEKTFRCSDQDSDRWQVIRVTDSQRLDSLLDNGPRPLLGIVDPSIEWASWQGLIEQLDATAIPGAIYGTDTDGFDSDEAVSLGAVALYPGDTTGLLGVAQLATSLAKSVSAPVPPPSLPAIEKPAEELPPSTDDDQIVYAISHDFQAPLQLTRRYAQILADDYRSTLDDEGRELVSHLMANLSRTQEMLDELLDYSRLRTHGVILEDVDLNALVKETQDLFQLDLNEAGALITCDPLPVRSVDRRQFLRLFQNLIGNSIKFRSDLPLRISIHYKETDSEWRMSFSDNGVGIMEADANRLFDMFKRGKTNKEYPGNGMGLAICKRIVENHGGRIWATSGRVWATSAPGKGCSINCAIPLHR